MAKALLINQLIEHLGLTVHGFEQAIGVSHGRIRKAIERNSDITPGMIDTIVSTFPNISKTWLLTGEGAMLANPSEYKARHGTALVKEPAGMPKHPYKKVKDFPGTARQEQQPGSFDNISDKVRNTPINDLIEELYAEIARLSAEVEQLKKRET